MKLKVKLFNSLLGVRSLALADESDEISDAKWESAEWFLYCLACFFCFVFFLSAVYALGYSLVLVEKSFSKGELGWIFGSLVLACLFAVFAGMAIWYIAVLFLRVAVGLKIDVDPGGEDCRIVAYVKMCKAVSMSLRLSGVLVRDCFTDIKELEVVESIRFNGLLGKGDRVWLRSSMK